DQVAGFGRSQGRQVDDAVERVLAPVLAASDLDLEQCLGSQEAADADSVYRGPGFAQNLSAPALDLGIVLDCVELHVLDDSHDVGQAQAGRLQDGLDLGVCGTYLLSERALDHDTALFGVVLGGGVAAQHRQAAAEVEAE